MLAPGSTSSANLRLDDRDPPLLRQRPVASGWAEAEVEPVLACLRFGHFLEPDRWAQAGRVE
jgi:hypothetical protein